MASDDSTCAVLHCGEDGFLPFTYGGDEWAVGIATMLCAAHVQEIAAGAEYWWDTEARALLLLGTR
ncbi:hypothetical protein [uncultured Amnibacterium sp.]|uniref:hypothetical protein n=1 Tax=uncultured Amnibacterium sp. TaxID=1631851 RepID=UPI0035CC198B